LEMIRLPMLMMGIESRNGIKIIWRMGKDGLLVIL